MALTGVQNRTPCAIERFFLTQRSAGFNMHSVSRRQALLATVTAFFLGQFNSPIGAAPAVLRIRVDQWKEIEVWFGQESVVFTGAELFAILKK